ncbi:MULTISPECIES: hypothetical protein [Novosphingobium]|uniref:hypothetical protein n=1 Tax=Novosphingobium TaxID=165696 RepID=UPI0022F26381|nr:hypothetical protein [Novosphingobium resinovorum]GLK42739.1 hypothetical protein GCM10017612_06560 [Novosphingobium resinovorum]
MITQHQAYLWGMKAARSKQSPPFNPFSNSAARAAWQNGYAAETANLQEIRAAALEY